MIYLSGINLDKGIELQESQGSHARRVTSPDNSFGFQMTKEVNYPWKYLFGAELCPLSPNSLVEVLTPSISEYYVFEDRAFEEVIELKWVH